MDDFIAARDRFKQLKRELSGEIDHHRGEIERIEGVIRKSRPGTQNGSKICDKCDTISMVYDRSEPNPDINLYHHIYRCEICGYEAPK